MKLKFTLLLLGAALCGRTAFAQMSGNYVVPSTATNGFSTLAAAVTALNTNGISSNVTINIAGGYVETAPTGGYILGSATLNASLNATKTLTFAKGSAGAKPVLKGYTGTSTITDCIFRIAGADYVTFDSLDLQQNNTDTTNITAMEIGYGLFNRSSTAPFDGCNHVTIKNNNITLKRSVSTLTRAIYSAHTTPTGTTALTITTAADLHSDNKFYSNNISNSVDGILLVGYDAPSPYTLYDQNNDIGGNSAATGNTFTNVLGNNFTGIAVIDAENQNNLNISNNSIDQLANGGITAIGGIVGIIASGTNSLATVSNNNISLAESSVNTAYFADGIYSTSGHLIARKNTITVSETGGQPVENVGIYYSEGTNLDADSNRININQARAGFTAGIYSDATGTIKVTSDTVTLTRTAVSSANYHGIYTIGNATTEQVQNNVFLNTALNIKGSGTVDLIYSPSRTPIKTISGNSTQGITTWLGSLGSSTFYGIRLFDSTGPVLSGSSISIYNNNFSNITTDSCLFYGVYTQGASNYQSISINNNTLGNFSGTTSTFAGIYYTSSSPVNIYSNTLSSVTTTWGNIWGIYTVGDFSSIENINKNKIYGFANTGGSGSINQIGGIGVFSSAQVNIHNNIIGLFSSSFIGLDYSNLAIMGIYAYATSSSASINTYYNTVYLNNNQGNNVSAAFTYTNFGISSGNLFTLKNNILVNASSSGIASAIHCATTSSGGGSAFVTNPSSNNNLLYAGTGSNSYILGSAIGFSAQNQFGYHTLAEYKTAFFPRDSASVTENPIFFSTVGSSANFLHFAPGTATLAESRGQNIAGYTTDFDSDIRYGNAGYTGSGSKPDIGADEGNFSYAYPLAIGLSSFTGKSIANGNQLDWKTATEAKSDIFELERSADGKEYTGIAIIAAKGIAATYTYLDEAPFVGKNFYRLKNSEATGSYTYSNVVVLSQQDKNARISISPNPATANVHVELPYNGDNTATLRILDITGKVIRTMQPTSAVMDINITDLATGKYILEYRDQVNTISTTIAKK